MGEMKEGLVIKGIGGFYYVEWGDVGQAWLATRLLGLVNVSAVSV